MARHHKSMKKMMHKEHITMHDREMDRKNLMHGMKDGHHRTKMGSIHSDPLEGYAGMDTRERNQYRTGEYVDESKNGYADMPQQVEYKMYAETPYGLDHYLDDGIGGIDSQVREDRDMVKRGLMPKKY
jgi:hypothetical protein